jgi:hypothetical protein
MRSKGPTIFAGYVHDARGPLGLIISTCCEGPDCLICAGDPYAAKRANNQHFPWPDAPSPEPAARGGR